MLADLLVPQTGLTRQCQPVLTVHLGKIGESVHQISELFFRLQHLKARVNDLISPGHRTKEADQSSVK